jgi:hypothetical protein
MRECAVGASRSASGFGCDEFPAAPRFTADAGSPAENARFERSAPVRSTTVSVQPVSTWEPNQLGGPACSAVPRRDRGGASGCFAEPVSVSRKAPIDCSRR